MGAEYQADWNTKCTLLVCAFPNTPKFRQVEADNGTIVSKDWITECHSQKQLVGIEPYLLHAGKPWRHQSGSVGASEDPKPSSSKNSLKQVDKLADSKPRPSASTKTDNKHSRNEFPTSEVKKWAIDDMKKTISWLDSQEEKPDPSEIKKIAAEGILTCLQDAIDSLKEGKGMEEIMEQWSFIPRVVMELNKLEIARDSPVSASKTETYKQAIVFKRIYETELRKLEDETNDKKKRQKIEKGGKTSKDEEGYDSDDTIEMTEEEVKEAFNSVASRIVVNDNQFGHR
ncbi:DNA-repair protein XRCC1 [Cynara cardunculus var. scolymus]|uniref:BRCT domain-containing protein n=1 Tax=Cynara cardunculus var. scolymus TaxID=59895 RepID=A0A103YBC7_CYNCS|nr:DNA-repair protein XRCC1 [Cynara cardunculus var. scolymus]KVI05969.1 BRCT domain-containing protein [Cynara cardunculus var. scolymus]